METLSKEKVDIEPADDSKVAEVGITRMVSLAPRPIKLEDTGLSETLVADLILKHLLDAGVIDLATLTERLSLVGPIVEPMLQFLRTEAKIEVRGGTSNSSALRYALTDLGRQAAQDAMTRSGYVGPAPVPLDVYTRVAKAQTVHGKTISVDKMTRAFSDLVLRSELVDQLGTSLNSGRAIFIYGPAGTGKTYITQKLSRMFSDVTLVPYAVSINETIVEVYDPVLHAPIDTGFANPNLMLESGFDQRFTCCKRPVVIVGGELTADMLEVHFDATTRQYQAPLQMKANNGIFIIDDMGRQRVAPETVFNRWIVPMEEKRDYLSLGAGRHFSIPFDMVLVFSTNLHPTDIADEAFLRRIGYKIEFPYPRLREYEQIWKEYCDENGITCSADVFNFVIHELYGEHQIPLLPCHPRDLLGIAVDQAAYHGQTKTITKEHMKWAWKNYFVLSAPGSDSRYSPSNDGGR